jgi:hypothetical protein
MRIPPARSAYLVGVVVTVALTALLTWGAMAPGYLLYRDFVTVPAPVLNAAALGAGGAPRSVPLDVVTALTTWLVPSWLVQKILLVAPLLLAGSGVSFLFNTTKPVNADEIYQNTRTLYVEPNTGLIINGVEQQNKRLEAPGFSAVPITQGTIGYTAATIKQNIADLGSKGTLLGFIHGPLTWIGLLLGLLLMGAGAFLALGGPKAKASTTRH